MVTGKSISIKKINSMFKFDEPLVEEIEKIVERYDLESSPGKIQLRDISKIGSKLGFFKKFKETKVACLFTTKGGVLKTTLSLNIARAAALSGVKTLVVGLDMQGDMTSAIQGELGEQEDFISSMEEVSNVKGLFDFYTGKCHLYDLIQKTDLECLHFIPETPELILLNDHINNINRREFWLNDKVLSKLKSLYDLIILDCSPSWNKLTTNALCASDLLISPIECKINNFRNLQVFNQLINEFKSDLQINFQNIYVPTKFSNQKKLSKEIYHWYLSNLDNVSSSKLSESVACEEAMAINKSVIEHKPSSKSAKEVKMITKEIGQFLSRDYDSNTEPEQELLETPKRYCENFTR